MAEKMIAPVENFDWDAYAAGEGHSTVDRADLVKTYDESLNTIKDKDVTEGVVISMNKREVVVNIGYKSDGIISMTEFRYNPELKVGDVVEVYIENQEDKKGQLVLSHKK
ncbi:MAG: S1 RNA-binding domain-containing protein, partial [Bacteroidales bacterium]